LKARPKATDLEKLAFSVDEAARLLSLGRTSVFYEIRDGRPNGETSSVGFETKMLGFESKIFRFATNISTSESKILVGLRMPPRAHREVQALATSHPRLERMVTGNLVTLGR
jgi:hypothetical protein